MVTFINYKYRSYNLAVGSEALGGEVGSVQLHIPPESNAEMRGIGLNYNRGIVTEYSAAITYVTLKAVLRAWV